MLLQLLKFTVPITNHTDDTTCVKWIFKEASDMKKLGFLHAPMVGSVVYKKKDVQKKKEKAKPAPKIKKPKKNKRSVEPPASLELAIPDEELDLEVEGEAGRQKWWLDDMVACILSPVQDLDHDEVKPKVLAKQIRSALLFCFTGSTACGEVALKGSWKELRKVLRMEVIKGHVGVFRRKNLLGLADPAAASETVVIDSVLQQMPAGNDEMDDADAVETAPKSKAVLNAEKKLAPFVKDEDFVLGLSQHMFSNKATVQAKFHPSFQHIVQDMGIKMQDACTGTGTTMLATEKVLDMILDSLTKMLPEKADAFLTELAWTVVELKDEIYDMAQMTGGLFESADAADKFLKLRAIYTMDLLHSCATSADRVSQEDLTTKLQALEHEFQTVVMGELMCADQDELKQFWLNILADPSKVKDVANEVVAKTTRARISHPQDPQAPQDTQESQTTWPAASEAAWPAAASEGSAPAAPQQKMCTLLHVRNTWSATTGGDATGPLILGFMIALENFIHQGVHRVEQKGAQCIFKKEAGQST